jgi:hypothetical protein
VLTIPQKILVFLARVGLYVYLSGGIYRLWSNIHRFLFDRKWKNVPLPTFGSIPEVVERMREFDWKRDGMSELFDAVCTPQKVEAVGFDGSSPHGNDCDEEAIWLTNVIHKSLPFKMISEITEAGLIGVEFFTVTWYERQGRFGGHNVCLLRYVDGFKFMDYSYPSRLCKSIDEVADLVIKTYAGWDTSGHGTQEAIRVVWCIADEKLRPLMTKIG